MKSTGEQKEESIAFSSPVFYIQLFDFFPYQPQQRFVLRNRFLVRVLKISQQAEVQVVVLICKEPDFKRLDQILDILSAYEHSRDHDQSTQFRRNSHGEVHSRQHTRRRQQSHQPVHQGYGQMTTAQEREDTDQPEWPTIHPTSMRLGQD